MVLSNSLPTARAFVVHSKQQSAMEDVPLGDFPPGEVVIAAEFSSLNYKDALAATGNPGVAPELPHIPGIDVAGTVYSSDDSRFAAGDKVFVTGQTLGAPRWGGWSTFVRVPGDWVLPVPPDLSARHVMSLGTAGFTAAQSVASLQLHGIEPDSGEVVVTGATGGVGSLAIRLLGRLGYQVAAITGKLDQADQLREWGAATVLPRDAIDTTSPKPMLKGRWAGGIDTVGGPVLAGLIKQIRHRGCVATCGNVAGTDLPLTVFPFILRGVKLDGIDSAMCPRPERLAIWERLFGPWRLDGIETSARVIALPQVADEVAAMLHGRSLGRVIIDLQAH